MNKNSDPLDYLIQCCESAVNTGHWKLTKFSILNAKDELIKLRQAKKDLAKELFDANRSIVDEINRNLDFKNVAWARINSRGDLYDLSLCFNRFTDSDTVLPLYSNLKEFKEKYGKLSQ